MGEGLSLIEWIDSKLAGPVPEMPDAVAVQVMEFFEDIRSVKASGKDFVLYVKHQRDMGNDDEADLFESVEQLALADLDRVLGELRARLKLDASA